MAPMPPGAPMPPMTPMAPTMPSGDLMNTSMNNYFHWGTDVTVLFANWPGHHRHNPGMYVLALAFVFLLALAVEILSVGPTLKRSAAPLVSGFSQTGVYALRTVLAYLVMLSVMSFNVGILMAVVGGHAVGFLVIKVRALNQLADNQGESNDSTKV